jgi:hypothetical protein
MRPQSIARRKHLTEGMLAKRNKRREFDLEFLTSRFSKTLILQSKPRTLKLVVSQDSNLWQDAPRVSHGRHKTVNTYAFSFDELVAEATPAIAPAC